MSERDKRLALNEALFREMNERVEERIAQRSAAEPTLTVVCECANLDCRERITLTIAEYEAAHVHPAQFTVAPGHETDDVEEVVTRTDRFAVVRKQGLAGAIAEDLGDS